MTNVRKKKVPIASNYIRAQQRLYLKIERGEVGHVRSISRASEVKAIVSQVSRYVLSLSTNALSKVKIGDIAVLFDINASLLSRRYKELNRCTLCEFIQREKIRRAVDLLQQERSMKISELAHRMGFSTPDYFIRFFKQRVGITPHKLRKYGLNGGKEKRCQANFPG